VAKAKLLIDTDIIIDYLNTGFLHRLFEEKGFEVYYSIITKKELLSKPGLRESERQAILHTLKRHRLIPLTDQITKVYSQLRQEYASLDKEDAPIAATALVKRLPLLTRNWKHYQRIQGLTLIKGRVT
jgi:predicted nucleic acid-binding protein